MEEDLEGLLHVSELSGDKVESPEEVVSIGQVVDVKVIRVDDENRKIGLSLKEVTEEESAQLEALYAQAAEGESPTAVGSVPENIPDEVPDIEDQPEAAPVAEMESADSEVAEEPAADDAEESTGDAEESENKE